MKSIIKTTLHAFKAITLSSWLALFLFSSQLALPVHAANFSVSSVNCTGTGSIIEAVAAANASPGTDPLPSLLGLK